MKSIVYILIPAFIIFASLTVKLSVADSDCPRKVEIMCYGYKDAPPGTFGKLGKLSYQKRWVDDNSFNRVLFLKEFQRLFRSSRLRLNILDRPEYSITATFSKTTDLENGQPMSCLTIVLAFNGGKGCYEGLSYSWIENRYPCAYHYHKLMTWTSEAPGHELSAHVSKMSAKINISEIENTMTSFEQIPTSAEFRKTPEWCNEPGLKAQSGGKLEIIVEKFKTSQPPMQGAAHKVKIIATSQKGTITNGQFIAEDPKAKVFTINPSEVSSSSTVQIQYTPPDGEDNSDILTIYNSCDVYYETEVPLNQTTKGSMLLEVENQCGWEGTISKRETMEAGENESILAALTPGGEYDISKNWNIQVKLKRTGDRFNSVQFEIDQAKLSDFEDELDATLARMEREGRVIESKTKQSASAENRTLSKSECKIRLMIDKEKGTYWISGGIDVQGIPIHGRDEMDIKVKPIDADIDEDAEGTTGIEETIEVSGTFKPEGPEKIPTELKGSKDLMKDLTPEFKKFMEDLGGKQTNILRWELKRKPVIIRKG
jgi:hypothetical protein